LLNVAHRFIKFSLKARKFKVGWLELDLLGNLASIDTCPGRSRFRPKVARFENELRDATMLAIQFEVAELRQQIESLLKERI
jgi:hypothetical protein